MLKVCLEKFLCHLSAFLLSGLGHYNITSVPTKLRGDIDGVNIIQVSSYGDCCLAVSDEGDVFGWGNSEYLQLASVTETTQVSEPGGVFLHVSVQLLHTELKITHFSLLRVLLTAA